MIDITGLREDKRPQSSAIVHALLDRLEAAEKERDDLRESEKWYRRRCDLLQEQQSKMRDPERTIVCDILSNGALLHADFAGDRYTIPGAQTQPAPSVPDGWLRAIDEALVTAHIGVANAHDTYEQAKAELDNLLGFHVDVATDPAVNGGYKLMPVEPTKEIYECFAAYDGTSYSNPFDFDDFRVDYAFAIEAAPEFKP